MTTDNTTTQIDPTAPDLGATLAAMTDAQIEAMVRDEPRAAEVLVARVMGWRVDEVRASPDHVWYTLVMPNNAACNSWSNMLLPQTPWEGVPRPLTDPAAFVALLDWAKNNLPGLVISHGYDGAREWSVWVEGGPHTDIVNESLNVALVTAVLLAARREAREKGAAS